jgi:SAM-dependent methyltransferase
MNLSTFSRPLLLDPELSRAEKAYIRIWGVPVLGLRMRARYLLPMIDRLPRDGVRRVADAGSGRGLFTVHLAQRFAAADVVGLDIDARQVERNNRIVAQLGVKNCRFELADVTQMGGETEWDLILSTDNLEHLEDDVRQARVFRDALAPNGRLLVHVPHRTRHVFGWSRENFMGIEGHVRPGYTREEMVSLLTSAGLEVELIGYSYNSIETLANDVSYLITGGRERRKLLYAATFPLLMAVAQLGRPWPARERGSGLIAIARRPEVGR